MFIARSVARRQVLGFPVTQAYRQMPLLGKRARRLYETVYGAEEYEHFCDDNQHIHGVPRPDPSHDVDEDDEGEEIEDGGDESSIDKEDKANRIRAAQQPMFRHKPEHDVESIFWVLFFTLIQANPSQTTKEVDNVSRSFYNQTLRYFRQHQIRDHAVCDGREFVLLSSKDEIKSMLHPELGSLAGMLIAMICQIAPEYGHLSGVLDPLHLHEAMRRILLNQIAKMEGNPIPLQPGNPRPGPQVHDAQPSSSV